MAFQDELYGMLMDVFRNVGTMPGQTQMERVHAICGKMSDLFKSAVTGEVFLVEYRDQFSSILGRTTIKMEEYQKVFDKMTQLTNTLREEHGKMLGKLDAMEEKLKNLKS